MSRRTDIAYEPRAPSTARSLNDGKLAIYKSSSVLARRFAVLEVHLIPFVKNGANFDNSVGNDAKLMLVLVTYLALFFCLGVVVSGQILTNGFVEPPVRPPQERDATQGGLPDRGTSDRLQSREAERTWVRTCVWWHWAFSLIACTVSFITQVLLYVWLEEPNSIRIVVSDALVNTTVSLAVAVHTFLSSHVGQLAFRIT